MRVRIFSLVLLSLIAALITGIPKAQNFESAEIPSDSPDILRLGSVKVLGSAACPPGAATGASCKAITVSCPGLADLNATLGSTLPSGSAKGTIILHSGGPGTSFFNSGFADLYVGDGFRLVQIAWASDWADANGAGVKAAACRPATVFKYAFNTTHHGSRTTGFCGQGTSGGGAALAYSLAQYGMANYFDYVVIAAGPGVTRMDYGCDPPLYTGSPRNLCPLLNEAPFAYTSGTASKVNTWEKTTTCGGASPLPSDISRWTADSIVTAGGAYSYPRTALSWFFCTTSGSINESTGQGSFLISQVIPKNNPPDVNCYSGICTGEAVWQDPNAFDATESEMLSQCVPNH